MNRHHHHPGDSLHPEADVSDDVGDVGEGKIMGLQKVFHAFLVSSNINMYLCSKNEQQ